MIDFNNTETAFAHRTDSDLNKAWLLFKMLSYPSLVKTANATLKIAQSLYLPVNWIVKPTVYAHFVGGETIEKSIPAVRNLEKFNVKAILDYSVEGGADETAIRETLEETLRSIKNAAADPNIPFAVFKPTAFGDMGVLEKASQKMPLTEAEITKTKEFRDRLHQLCETAYQHDIPILIDAEDSWYQAFIDEVVDEMMQKFNQKKVIVFNTFQMYRHDRLVRMQETLKKSKEGGYFAGLKFVRGAYMEKERARAQKMGYPSPIYPDKAGTDEGYNTALKLSVDHIDHVMIFNGTHNEDSCLLLAKLMEEKGLAKNDPRIWFSQLYGMSDHISFNLAKAGFNVAKYVPYGPVKSVMPYLFRRAEENTSIAGQTGRELRLLSVEKKRRHKAT